MDDRPINGTVKETGETGLGGFTYTAVGIFLYFSKKDKTPVRVTLANGAELEGMVATYDHSGIVLNTDVGPIIVPMHAMAFVQPVMQFVNLRQLAESALGVGN